MSVKAALSLPFAKIVAHKIKKWANQPIAAQEDTLKLLISKAKNTSFGKDHHFDQITDYDSFKKHIPVTDYEGLKGYIEEVKLGKPDILWPGKPIYWSKTSGTTSGTKYIPITKDSIEHHIVAARNSLLLYIEETGKIDFVSGKMIFLQGSPEMDELNGIPVGRLSGIVAHHVPKYLQKNRLPSWKTNCIEDWEQKVEAIVDETLKEEMSLISGIPPWVQMYFERILNKTEQTHIKDVFPKFSLMVYGGVNYEPYIKTFQKLIGKDIDTIELYPASEGFIAFQNEQKDPGLLLNLDAGIFYEFIPADEFFEENPTRISLKDVQLGVNYVIILNTTAGLWGYNIGDTIKFTSLKPYKIKVTGRIKHFTSAFGEHVIAEEVEKAMLQTCKEFDVKITEYSIAPQVSPAQGLPYHEWLVEFESQPENIDEFAARLDVLMQSQNVYYQDLIQGSILRPIVISSIVKGGFIQYMKSIGKLGGQNKVPRLSNDRTLADGMSNWIIND